DLIKRLQSLLEEVKNLKEHLLLPQKEQRILEMEDLMQDADFWKDNEHAQKVSQEYNQLKKFYDFWNNLEKQISENLDLVKQNTDESEDTKKYLENQVVELEKQYKQNRFVAL